jgi:hypothetical protein
LFPMKGLDGDLPTILPRRNTEARSLRIFPLTDANDGDAKPASQFEARRRSVSSTPFRIAFQRWKMFAERFQRGHPRKPKSANVMFHFFNLF